MSTPREPYRAPFEERGPADGPSPPARPVSPTPPPLVRPAWYRRPLPPVRRWVVVLVVLLLVAGGTAAGIAVSSDGSDGSVSTSPSATVRPASPTAVPTSATTVTLGTPAPVVQSGRRVGTVTLLAVGKLDTLAGAVSRYGAFMTFQVQFGSPDGSLFYSPASFDVTGANAGPVIAGGRAPQLGTGTVGSGGPVTAYLTIDAPAHGTLLYSPDPAQQPTVAWTY